MRDQPALKNSAQDEIEKCSVMMAIAIAVMFFICWIPGGDTQRRTSRPTDNSSNRGYPFVSSGIDEGNAVS